MTVRFTKSGKEKWFELSAGGGSEYVLVIVEKQAMQQDVAANADALQNGLTQSGHVEVPGILFDIGKSDVKP